MSEPELREGKTLGEILGEAIADQNREIESLRSQLAAEVERREAATTAIRDAKMAIESAMILSSHSQQWKRISEAHSILILALGDQQEDSANG